jgi:hypothetical protein
MINVETKVESMEEEMLDSLMQGSFDMHVHSSPDLMPRKMSDIALAKGAKAAHMAGVMLKCHYCPTAARAALVRECVSHIAVFGSIVLNRAVGGLNPDAVETALALGAKEVFLPTISAVNHLTFGHGDIAKAVPVVDEDGEVLPELYPILEMIAERDCILGTGHLSPRESVKVIALAQKKGVRKIMLTHPEYEIVAMPVDMQQELARQGVYFERCFYATNSSQKLPVEEVARQIKAVGPESTVMSSDFGQMFNELPTLGFRRYVREIMECGIPAADMERMIKANPKELVGLK